MCLSVKTAGVESGFWGLVRVNDQGLFCYGNGSGVVRRVFESFCRGGKSVLLKAVQVGLVNGSRWPLGPPDVRSRASQGKGLSGGGQVGGQVMRSV